MRIDLSRRLRILHCAMHIVRPIRWRAPVVVQPSHSRFGFRFRFGVRPEVAILTLVST